MLIRGQPSSISSFLWAQSGGPTPATGVGMVSAGQLPSHGGELVLAVAAEGWAWGWTPRLAASSFCKQPGGGLCWWLPAQASENQPVRRFGWHATGGQCFIRTQPGLRGPCHLPVPGSWGVSLRAQTWDLGAEQSKSLEI